MAVPENRNVTGRKRWEGGDTVFANFKKLPQKAALVVIRLYQLAISPHTRPSCRFYPSCSVYAYQAIETHGLVKGAYLAARRLLRCHPFHAGGYDPVPAQGADSSEPVPRLEVDSDALCKDF